MSDHADRADSKIFAAVATGLAAIRRRESLLADGHCHFCDEMVLPERLFCNLDCRDDFEREKAAAMREGRA